MIAMDSIKNTNAKTNQKKIIIITLSLNTIFDQNVLT